MADLKPPLKGYSLWFMAKEDAHKQLEAIVNRLTQKFNTRRFEPHATLSGLLNYSLNDLAVMVDITGSMARKAQCFNVEIIGVGKRNMHLQSIILPVVPHTKMMELNRIARTCFHHENDPPYFPHFSALYGDLSREEKLEAQDLIEEIMNFPTSVTIDSIALVEVHGHPDEWKIVTQFPLRRIGS